MNKIVVGTDGSNTARLAVARAADLARATDAELHVVSVYKKDASSPFEGSTIELCRRILDEVKEAYKDGVKLKTVLKKGDPSDALIDVAEEEGADVIVVGNVGLSERKRAIVGNVPHAVSHHAPCHVMIVHTSGLLEES